MSPTEKFQTAIGHHKAGRLKEAEVLYRELLSAEPGHPDVSHLLGLIARQSGRSGEAVALLARAAESRRDDATLLNNLGNAFTDERRFEEAVGAFRRAIELRAAFPAAYSNLARALLEQGRLEEAVAASRKALDLNPELAEAWYNLGRARKQQGVLYEAVAAYQEAVSRKPGFADAQRELGLALQDPAYLEEAARLYHEEIAQGAVRPGTYNSLGVVLEALGDLDGAVASYREALAADPAHAEARRNLVWVRRNRPEEGQDQEIEGLLGQDDLPERDRMRLHFALGRVYEDYGEHERSFEHYRRANALKRGTLVYDAEGYTSYVDRLMETFSASLIEEKTALGHDTSASVFIVGMPRSGTTLAEQIISAHPRVRGAGEVEYFAGAVSRMLEAADPYPGCVRRWDAPTVRALAQGYLERLGERALGADLVTDKMPQNFMHLGLIRIVFPGARIVHCRRDPRDTCFSIYASDFMAGHGYACDLYELGCYYRDYQRLMEHWRGVLGARMFELEYEALIADQEGVSRRLIEFLGLEWDDRCLAYHENPTAAVTASRAQVREPIYTRSVSRWRRYEPFLGPLLEGLGEG